MKKVPKSTPNLLQRIRSNFLTGLVLITPIVLTLYMVWGAVNFIDDKVVPWLPSKYNPSTYIHAQVSDVVDHIDRVVELVGIDHVGIGSDYDGVGDTLPNGLKDVSSYPNLIAELQKRGYSTSDIQKILGGNFARVWREVEEYARNN